MSMLKKYVLPGAAAVVACTVLTAFGTWFYGSFSEFRAAVAGRSVFARVALIASDTGSPDTIRALVSLKNLSPYEIRLLGSNSSCGCTAPDKLPEKLRAFERRWVSVIVHPDATPRQIRVSFITNIRSEQPEVTFMVSR